MVAGGVVARMIITGSGTWDYKYSAAAKLPLGIPEEIICGGSEHCISKIMIKEMMPAMPSEEMKIFDPQGRIDKSIATLTVLSNGVEIVKPSTSPLAARRLAKVELAPSGAVNSVKLVQSSETPLKRRVTILSIILLSSIGFAILAIRSRRNSKHELT